MYDLRAGVAAAITALNQTYIGDKVYDYKSTANALATMQQAVFTDAAAILGDWRYESFRFVYAFDRVVNELELLICVRSATAKAALDDIVRDVSLHMNNHNFGQNETILSEVDLVTEADKHEQQGMFYVILRLRVIATQPTSLTATPTIAFSGISDGSDISLVYPASQAFTVTYSSAFGPVAHLQLAMGNTVTGKNGLYGYTSTPTGGSHTFTFTNISATDVPGGSYTLTAIIIDNNGKASRTAIAVTVNQV